MHKNIVLNLVNFCLILILFGCQPNNTTDLVLDKPICIPSQSDCTVNTAAGLFSISFNQIAPKAELPFEIHLEYTGGGSIKKVSGYLEGVDMFMGKIPLFFSQSEPKTGQNPVYIAQAMFGSCSLKEMKWKAIFIADIEHNQNTVQQLFTITFSSKQQ